MAFRNPRTSGVSRWQRVCRIVKDDEAQAMTEYVIVIPVVLFMFFAAVQTMVIAQTVQAVNYAAFAAARSYATGYAKFQRDNSGNPHGDAEDRAYLVACMAMAPVSTGMNPNPGYAGLSDEIPGSFFGHRQSAAGDDQVAQSTLEGFAVAYTYRLKQFQARLVGGNDNDATEVVEVTFNYNLPLLVPGLAEMWNYFETKPGSGNLQLGRFESRWPPNFSNSRNVADYTKVLNDWMTINNAALASAMVSDYTNYANTRLGANSPGAPANLTINGRCMIGFEPLVGQML